MRPDKDSELAPCYWTGHALSHQPADKEAAQEPDWRNSGSMGCRSMLVAFLQCGGLLCCCSTDGCIVIAVSVHLGREPGGISDFTDSCIGGRSGRNTIMEDGG